MIKSTALQELINDIDLRQAGAPWYKYTQNKFISIYGLGGIGSHTFLGIFHIFKYSNIYLFDPDRVEVHNLGGQIYNPKDLGSYKTCACAEGFYNLSKNEIYTSQEDYYSISDITILALDNMAAREKIAEEMLTKTRELFIDARMSADTIQVIAIDMKTPDKEERIKEYKNKYLFSDSEALPTLCNFSQSYFVGQLISGIIGSIVTNCMTHSDSKLFPQRVPFFTEFYIPLMKYNEC